MRVTLTELPRAEIPTAQLAGLLLLLVLFLLLAAVHELDRTGVGLPSSASRVEAPRGAALIVIAREPGGAGGPSLAYRFSDGRDPARSLGGPTDIYLAALRVIDSDPTKPFVIKADASVRYSLVDDVLEQLRKAGVRDLTLLTRRASEREP